ncbi:putative NIF3 family GTP cyclohydrolase 1 type 2 [Salirhabdus euzebyi]|uniref:GTP cyclohydrolase 1 type 2 homolog n=1 Tax=Salirhabdus euzebyi TaxID=394506 RepID=A0A841Q569_9BACI|nr:Nif3-like dinuclear metal center hexameric protein [Salirhabdus euzebyi]MBB6453538.1 putative NIF3 family GTP cyclohydrolase 1 type 2 [Salirhabdus euzebyi]
MIPIQKIVHQLDQTFAIQTFGPDSAFSRFIPEVYDSINYDWKSNFDTRFTELFNGLMIRGADNVQQVFLAVFPTEDVLNKFISQSVEGDLLFMHHPLVMECGDPRGNWGKGFVPIPPDKIAKIKEKNLSVYTCHVPMDYHKQLGTSIAIATALSNRVIDRFIQSGEKGHLGLIIEIDSQSTEDLIAELKNIFAIPYVDFEGKHVKNITKVAIVAGCGDKVNWMQEAEKKGVQAYITGEIHCHIDNDYGRKKYSQMVDYAKETSMSLIGVSHAASEYLVKKTRMTNWFQKECNLNTILLPQEKWWV